MSTSDRLYTLLYGTWQYPKRARRMTGRNTQSGKYIDIEDYSFTPTHLAEHLAGRETYATTLGVLGEARSGCKDYDEAEEAEILAALDAAAAKVPIASLTRSTGIRTSSASIGVVRATSA
jgi:hypothetical protein